MYAQPCPIEFLQMGSIHSYTFCEEILKRWMRINSAGLRHLLTAQTPKRLFILNLDYSLRETYLQALKALILQNKLKSISIRARKSRPVSTHFPKKILAGLNIRIVLI